MRWFGDRRSAKEPPEAPPRSLDERLAAWDPDTSEPEVGFELCETLLTHVAVGLEGAAIRRVDEEVELRGRAGEVPVRLRIYVVDPEVRLALRLPHEAGRLSLRRDPAAIPAAAAPDDELADDAPLRLFVARGVFLHGDRAALAEGLETLSRIAPRTREALLTELDALEVELLEVAGDSLEVELAPPLPKIAAPVERLRRLIALARGFASALPVAAAPTPALAARARCRYCGTSFPLALRHACPNCGAPHAT
ncbi:MAG: hypothetical protein KF729_14155 [Sandaracinaceae bacterium]|nr:hypothetical protein [Sandaracinaceae bacterium]